VQGYACRIGGGGFEQAVERTSFMVSNGFSALELFLTPTKGMHCKQGFLYTMDPFGNIQMLGFARVTD